MADAIPAPRSASTAVPDDARAPIRLPWGVVAAVLLVAGGLMLLRQEGVGPFDSVWAEDGAVYYTNVLDQGAVGPLFRGYSSYVQLVPRTLAAGLVLIPVEQVPVYLVLGSVAVSVALAAFVYRGTRRWVASDLTRLVVAVAFLLAPVLGREAALNLANLPQLFVAAVPWAFLSLGRRRGDVVARSVVAVLAPLSHPLTFLYAPMAGMLLWQRRRDRQQWVVTSSYAVGAVVQIALMQFAERRGVHYVEDPSQLWPWFSVNLLGTFLVGERWRDSVWESLGRWSELVLAGATALLFVVLAAGARVRRRALALTFVVYAAAFVLLPVWTNGSSAAPFVEGSPSPHIDRYLAAPVLLLITAVALLVDPPDPTRARPVARYGRLVLGLAAVVLVVSSFRLTNGRSAGPNWSEQVANARARCAATGAETDLIATSPPGWAVVVPCDRL